MSEASPHSFPDIALRERLILVISPSEASFRLIERILEKLPDTELRWHSRTIEALADIFMARPDLVVVFGDSNQESFGFIQLVRNNTDFHATPVFAVLPEPLRLRHRFVRHLKISEFFSTPLDSSKVYQQAKQILFPQSTPLVSEKKGET